MKKAVAGVLVLSLALANPLPSPPAEEELSLSSTPGALGDFGGVVGLLCQFGNLEVRFGDWSFDFCSLFGLFRSFEENFQRFQQTMGLAFLDLNAPLLATQRDTAVVSDLAKEAYKGLPWAKKEVNLPAFQPPKRDPGTIYEEAFQSGSKAPKEAEEEALQAVEQAYKTYFDQLVKATAPTEEAILQRVQRINDFRRDIARLQEDLERTPFGSAEAGRVMQQIFQKQDALSQEARELAQELAYAKSLYTGLQGVALQALRRYDQTVSAVKAKTPTLAAAQAAKRISEKLEEFQKLIEDTAAKTEALVEEAQNATSTRAAVQIAVKGIAQLAESQVVTQSLLYQALAELAQQNVYTNQQLAYQTERIANLLGQQVASVAQEAANEVGYTIGQLEAATQTVEGVRRFYKSLYDTQCDWYWKPQECLENKGARTPNF